MGELPVARVVSELAVTPRAIPFSLRIQIAFGGQLMRGLWICLFLVVLIADVTVGMARLNDHDEQSGRLRTGIIVIGVVLLAIVGVVQLWWTRRQTYLLRHGIATVGRLSSTSKIQNDEVQWVDYTFLYVDGAGQQQLTTVTTAVSRPELEDEAEEPLLYDPAGAHKALPLDYIPGQPRIDDNGKLRPRRSPVGALVLPTITLIGFVALALLAR